jgi:uncharacterized protein (TIGR03083 family)
MSLETAADARRALRQSRAEYDSLLAYLEQLPPEGWTEQSACKDWQVYQVVSHIGSQPEIVGGAIKSAVTGGEPMTDEQRKAIWAHFDSLQPHEVLPAFRKNNDDYYKLLDSFGDAELGRTIPWFIGPAPMAVVLASRLNEQALHQWDVRWARDKRAKLTPEAVPTLIELNLMPQFAARLAKPDQAPRLAGKPIQFLLRDPEDTITVEASQDGTTVSHTRATSPALTAELSAEAFARLIWGRYDTRAGLQSGELKLSDPSLADELQGLLPGR